MNAVVLGIGQPLAGDDGVGPAVARLAAARGLPAREATDASALLDLLQEGRRVVVVDAVRGGGEPGDVLLLSPDRLATGPRPVSSHGLGVAEAVALARLLSGPQALTLLAIVGVVTDGTHAGPGLSIPVASAIPRAFDLVLRATAGHDEGPLV